MFHGKIVLLTLNREDKEASSHVLLWSLVSTRRQHNILPVILEMFAWKTLPITTQAEKKE